MNEKHRKAFEDTDLGKYFEQYCTEKFVQARLRDSGFNTVGDLLTFDRVDVQVLLSRDNQKVQKEGLALYDRLHQRKQKIKFGRRQRTSPDKLGKAILPSTNAQAPSADINRPTAAPSGNVSIPESDSRTSSTETHGEADSGDTKPTPAVERQVVELTPRSTGESSEDGNGIDFTNVTRAVPVHFACIYGLGCMR